MVEDPSPFTILRPITPGGGVVYASPHSGRRRPADFGPDPTLDELSLRSAEDAEVDRLIAGAAAQGVPVLLAGVSRAYVDLNRAEDDLDPLLVDGVPKGAIGPGSRHGFGVVPRLTGDGRPLHARRLSPEEADRRIERWHRPYHAALTELMRQARGATGRAVLIDWHSMPTRATVAASGGRGAEVVLGDRHGTSCDPALTRAVRRAFEAKGFRVAMNHPYSGGHTTRLWGRVAEGYEALQIELARGLYLDEATLRPNAGLARCERAIQAVTRAVIESAGQKKGRT